MKHLDEGTIHAWLDGALGDAEARDVSGHVDSCAECAARVAEARGFVAGASRILTALDDVPAVEPKRAPVPTVAPRARPFWQAAPWVTGIAAVLMLAIGVKEWRERPSAQVAFAPAERVLMDSLNASPLPQARPVDSSLRLKEVNAPAPKLVALPPPAGVRRGVVDFRGGPGAAGGVSGAGSISGARDDASRQPAAFEKRQKAEIATEAAPAPTAVVVTAQGEPKKAAAADELRPSAALIPAAPAPLSNLAVRARVRDERQLAGCYRVGGVESQSGAVEAIAKSVAGAREPRAAARLAPSSAPAAAAPLQPPPIVRLDTTMTSGGRVIVSPSTGETIGTWRAADGDSVRLVMLVAGVRTISLGSRVACPATPEGRP